MKITKKLITALAALSLALLCSVQAFADTYYYTDGYIYTMPDQSHAVIYGIDSEDYSEVVFPEFVSNKRVSAVGIYAFRDDEKVTSVSCENASRMEKISAYSFKKCKNLTSVKLSPSIVTIGVGAFEGCTSLASVDFAGSGVEVIPTQAFYGCAALKEVEIPSKVTTIGPFAFANCSALSTVTIGDSVTEIAETAFDGDDNVIIACNSNTYALQYAEENEIDHIVLDGDKTGDVNGDGAVDILDATEIQKYAAESTDFTDEQFELGDINKDGYCDVIDALLVQKSVIGAYEIPQNIIRY